MSKKWNTNLDGFLEGLDPNISAAEAANILNILEQRTFGAGDIVERRQTMGIPINDEDAHLLDSVEAGEAKGKVNSKPAPTIPAASEPEISPPSEQVKEPDIAISVQNIEPQEPENSVDATSGTLDPETPINRGMGGNSAGIPDAQLNDEENLEGLGEDDLDGFGITDGEQPLDTESDPDLADEFFARAENPPPAGLEDTATEPPAPPAQKEDQQEQPDTDEEKTESSADALYQLLEKPPKDWPKPEATRKWTTNRTKLLGLLWGEGLSARQIAEFLGHVSRNSVIGKAHRLGLSTRAVPSKPIFVSSGTSKKTCQWVIGNPAGLKTQHCAAAVYIPGHHWLPGSLCEMHYRMSTRGGMTVADKEKEKEIKAKHAKEAEATAGNGESKSRRLTMDTYAPGEMDYTR